MSTLLQRFSSRHRELIRRWIPVGIRERLNDWSGFAIQYVGTYQDWGSACAVASGYASPSLFERIEQTALSAKARDGAWEQDGVLYDRIPPNFPVLAAIEYAAVVCRGSIRVLDYGGGLGSSYYQAKHFLPAAVDLNWTILEQAHFVECGQRHFATNELRFVATIEEAIEDYVPDVVLLSSVLQYLEKPYEILEKIEQTGSQFIVIDRNPVSDEGERLTVQVVPQSLYAASYPSWLFDGARLYSQLTSAHELLVSWDGTDPPIRGRGFEARFGGSFWRRRGAR